MSRRGFTLLELVVVVAILAVLTAILLPLTVRHGHARKDQCHWNLKVIGSATQQYCQDYDGRFPPASVANPAHPDPWDHVAAFTWDEVLGPYLKHPSSLRCLSDPLAQTGDARSYAANAWVVGTGYCHPRWLRGAPRYALGQDDMEAPAEVILYGERWGKDPIRLAGRADYHITCDRPEYNTALHEGRPIYAFVDGHVKSMRYEATVQERNLWRPARPAGQVR